MRSQATRSGGSISPTSRRQERTSSSIWTRACAPVEFEIDDQIYRNVLKHAVRMYFYQRAGFEKTAATAGPDWADAASHMRTAQDPQTRPWQARWSRKRDASKVKDLHGGWFDAGDYNKYTSWTARNLIVLLRAYAENPNAFGDDSGIPSPATASPTFLTK